MAIGTNIAISDTYSIESYNWFHFYFQVSWAHKTSDGGLDFLTIGNSTYTSESRISSVFLHPSNWGLRIANLQVESRTTLSFFRLTVSLARVGFCSHAGGREQGTLNLSEKSIHLNFLWTFWTVYSSDLEPPKYESWLRPCFPLVPNAILGCKIISEWSSAYLRASCSSCYVNINNGDHRTENLR